ncbi:hypothetical protein [Streptomyces sp. NBC_00829]|uniref:hypothetical protein n=1 Tax=Streptomyces sp. NBC_00829 TaxID=2903679 RepID=UPI002F915A20|nr:hypothetical protein OG293_40065 [Streptomyces sp. NBC_00829]
MTERVPVELTVTVPAKAVEGQLIDELVGRGLQVTQSAPRTRGDGPVVQEDPHLLQDRDDMANPQVEGTERGEYLAVADDVALGVSGEHDGQAAVDSEADAASPAPGLGELVGEVLRPGQPRAGQVGSGWVESAVVTWNLLEQWQLPPTGSRPRARHGGGRRDASRALTWCRAVRADPLR